jgi:hypothetical protein
MGGKTPTAIKLQVLKCWLSGLSRDDISINIGISTGSVSNIIKECRKYKDIESFRSVAVKMKNQGLELNDLASSLRLKNMLDLLELPEERLEKFLQALSIYNYKNDINDSKKFICEVEKFSQYVASLDISVFDLVDYVDKKKTELKELDKEIFLAKMDLGALKYKQEEIRSNIKKLGTTKRLKMM